MTAHALSAATSHTGSLISAGRPVYSSPAKTLRAAEAAMAELAGLSGEALRKQQERVNELVIEANRQNQAFKKKNPGAGSQVHSARPNSQKTDGEASSPHPSRSKSKSRSRSRGSGKNKQLQAYDPAFAGIQQVGQHNSG